MAILDNYSKEEFNYLASQSKNFADFSRKLGYITDSTNTRKVIKKKIEEFQTDISHFTRGNSPIQYSEKEVFCLNSKAGSTTVRRWYKKNEYTSYVCDICGMEPIWQGKPLTLILDHKDGNHNNNELNNLHWVCPNCNQQLPTTGYKNEFRKIIKHYCIDCGKEISPEAVRCLQCAGKLKITALENMPLTREELKNLIRTTPFTTIGKMYNVSDNAIRKWCIKFELPSKAREIKKYTDEEWQQI